MQKLEKLFTEALGIPSPWKITNLVFNSEAKKLDIHVNFERGATFEWEDTETCETSKYTAYDTVEKTWRHLNFFEHECYLHARVPRIKPKSGGIKMILPAWSGCVSGFTMLFEALVLQMCRDMPVHKVGAILKISDRKLWHLLECYVNKGLYLADYSKIIAVGVDETSLKRGHNYISLFADLTSQRTMFISEGKDHTTVTNFVEHLESGNGKRENIKDVSCDMSAAFIKGVREELPSAQITFDRFHIIKLINEGVDIVRRVEAKDNPLLKGSRYALLKNAENLTEKQKAKIENLSKFNVKSIRALHIRENFQAIYKAQSLEEFVLLLKQWYFWATHSRLKPIIKAAKTIKNHWDGIVRWKESQINNGILEGLNSVVQAAKRKARGYKFKHFQVIAYLLTGKLQLHLVNPFLPTHFA